MGDEPIPDSCERGEHTFGQAGRCRDCGIDSVDARLTWDQRRSGGAGSRRHPTTNGEYRKQMRKLQR